MGRSRSSRSAPAPARRAPAPAQPKRQAPPPAKTQAAPAPAPAQQSSGMLGGLMSTVASGMAFGTGSAIAHRAVGAVTGSFGGSSEAEQEAPVVEAAEQSQPQAQACFRDQKAFLDCLNVNQNDISSCQFYLDQFNQCKTQSSYM